MRSKPKVERSRWLRCRGVALIVFAASMAASCSPAQTTLIVSAAASLKDALVETEAVYKQSRANVTFVNNFGSSGMLAVQIAQGAPTSAIWRL